MFGANMSSMFSAEFSKIFQGNLAITSGKICKEIREYFTATATEGVL